MEKVNSKVSKPVIVFLIVMTVLSFSNCVKIEIEGDLLKLAGFTVLVGIAAYFITRNTNEYKNAGLDIKALPRQIVDKKVIVLILIPAVINVISTFIEKSLMPDYFEFLKNRIFIDSSNTPKMLIELIVLALGEEIALRAFYQKQTTKIMGFVPSLIISSIAFTFGHFSYGEPVFMVWDLSGIFINSIFYGIVFKKTDNAWCSWISHFLANIVAMILLL
ncbi:MAG: CPBP family intramembrane metalloprotease [Lachnospiraceae bacterium]|nr:CPBP family intramembrane metalloprotease [Lachnospiraceae bacterium]